MADRLFEPVGVGDDPQRRRRRASGRHDRGAWRRWPRQVERSGSGSTALEATRGPACGARRASRSFILPTETFQGRDHVGAELGIVGVPLGIARDQRQLADEILDVVEDEGEAAVEFLEPLGVRQRLLAMRFGERAGRLAPGGAQQVEILPVERAAVIGRGEQDEADQPVVVDQRNAGPAHGLGEHPGGGDGELGLAASSQPSRCASNSRIRPSRSTARQKRRRFVLASAPGLACARPIPVGGRLDRARPRRRRAACRRARRAMSANALTTRSPSGAASRPERPTVSVKRSHSVR